MPWVPGTGLSGIGILSEKERENCSLNFHTVLLFLIILGTFTTRKKAWIDLIFYVVLRIRRWTWKFYPNDQFSVTKYYTKIVSKSLLVIYCNMYAYQMRFSIHLSFSWKTFKSKINQLSFPQSAFEFSWKFSSETILKQNGRKLDFSGKFKDQFCS